jgi:predicted RNA-binding protein with PIN domain
MTEPTLYLFDGYNLLHASELGSREVLVDRLAGFVALRGARGIVVFDGAGDDVEHGPLQVRFAAHADRLLERLAAEHRDGERICLVSSDRDIRQTAGQEVGKRTSKEFAAELAKDERRRRGADAGSRIEDALPSEVRDRLEEWRRRRP